MAAPPLDELLQALGEGLARPHHFWTLIVVLLAMAGGRMVSGLVHGSTQAKLDSAGEGGDRVDALRFSIDGVRRLAFPVATQALLWAGEAVLRLTGVLGGAGEVQLLRLAMTLFAAMAGIRLLVYVTRRVLRSVTLIAAFERTIALTMWLLVALHVTGWLGAVIDWLEATRLPLGRSPVSLWVLLMGALSVLVTLVVALWIGSSLESRLMRATTLDTSVRVVMSRVLRAVLLVFAVLIALSLVGIDLTVLSVFGGALGVGLGLGLQRIASNYVSGFIVLLERSLRIGDMITVDKYSGAITQINTRYTVIRALDGNESIIPNEMLVAQPVINHSFSDTRVRLAVRVAVAYDSDVRQVLRLMEEAASGQPRVLDEPPPSAMLTGFGADGLEMELGFWIADPHNGRMGPQSAVAQAVLERFRAAGISIPYPQRDVRVVALPPAGTPLADTQK